MCTIDHVREAKGQMLYSLHQPHDFGTNISLYASRDSLSKRTISVIMPKFVLRVISLAHFAITVYNYWHSSKLTTPRSFAISLRSLRSAIIITCP